MVSDEPISFIEKRRKFLEEKAKKEGTFTPPPAAPTPQFSDDLIPDVLPERTEEESEMDRIIDSIGVLEAYNKWCGKSRPDPGKKREGIKVSCPNPQHPDRDPSAWLNLDKNTWFCGGCQEGGDVYDIAAFRFGFPVPGYKEGATFHKLRESMAESMGYTFKKVAGGKIMIPPADEQGPVSEDMSGSPQNDGVDKAGTVEVAASPGPSSVPAPGDTPSDGDTPKSDTLAPVINMGFDEEEELVPYPSIDWREIVPVDTFLYEYMEACTNDDSPEEYHFWHGLLALGHAVGRKVTLDDHRPVYANLLLCLLGGTGTGKSRSRGWLDTVIREALPYQETGLDTTGVKLVPVPSSGEYLVKQFSYESRDPANSKAILGYAPVNGIVDFDELSGLLARSNRQGSTLKPTIMSFADTRDHVSIGGLAHGGFFAERPFCSITATTQPKAIRTLLNRTDTGSGFLNRWVFAGGPSKEREALGGARSKRVINLDKAIEQLKLVRGYGGFERSIPMDDSAYARWESFFHDTIDPAQRKDETDLLKRLDLLFKKLVLFFTINRRSTEATLQDVEAAISLWQYIIDCYGILNENIGVTHSSEIAQEILRLVQQHTAKFGKGPSARDIAKYTKRKNYSPEQIKKALETMVALDWLDIEKPKSNMGRPTVRYTAVGE